MKSRSATPETRSLELLRHQGNNGLSWVSGLMLTQRALCKERVWKLADLLSPNNPRQGQRKRNAALFANHAGGRKSSAAHSFPSAFLPQQAF